MTKKPPHDCNWDDDAEEGFSEWFHELVGFSFRSEWFDDDCEMEDEKTRRDLMYKWIHTAYVMGYERGRTPE